MNLGSINWSVGKRYPIALPSCFIIGSDSGTYLKPGAKNAMKSYFWGFLIAILKQIVPPKLNPEMMIFGFCLHDLYLSMMKSTKVSASWVSSSKEAINPLMGPSERPKFLKSSEYTSTGQCLAILVPKYPELPPWLLSPWNEKKTALGYFSKDCWAK